MNSTRFMRAGNDRQYLHLRGCSRYQRWHHWLGLVDDWTWANHASHDDLVTVVRALDLKLCRSCHPMGQIVRSVR
jgi:hypothetical protein